MKRYSKTHAGYEETLVGIWYVEEYLGVVGNEHTFVSSCSRCNSAERHTLESMLCTPCGACRSTRAISQVGNRAGTPDCSGRTSRERLCIMRKMPIDLCQSPAFIDAMIYEFGPLTQLEVAILLPKIEGKTDKVSRQRIQQLEVRAMKKLKSRPELLAMKNERRVRPVTVWEDMDSV